MGILYRDENGNIRNLTMPKATDAQFLAASAGNVALTPANFAALPEVNTINTPRSGTLRYLKKGGIVYAIFSIDLPNSNPTFMQAGLLPAGFRPAPGMSAKAVDIESSAIPGGIQGGQAWIDTSGMLYASNHRSTDIFGSANIWMSFCYMAMA